MAKPNAALDTSQAPAVWTQVLAGALLMLATLPGRTYGLGLITEPLLADVQISRDSYAQINLWATLLGSAACLPVGAWLDRKGVRTGALVLLPALAAVVALMAWIPNPGLWGLFGLVFMTRAVGQSALSVLSIAVAGRAFKNGTGIAAGVYALLLSMFFAIAVSLVGEQVQSSGWRTAWGGIAAALVVMMPVAMWLRGGQVRTQADAGGDSDLTLAQCMRQPVFWIYVAGIAAFTSISAGTSLFNQALLAERGFDQKTFFTFQAVSFLIALVGQVICGVGSRWLPVRFWLALSLVAQAGALAMFSRLGTVTSLWTLAGMTGLSCGIITVAFFSIWGETFGRRHLGRVMGMAQMFSVFASATGPLLLERGHAAFGTYAAAMLAAAPVVLVIALLSLWPPPRRASVSFSLSATATES